MRAFDRNEPMGRLDDFQRHKVRMWTVLPANLWRAGRADVGLMYSYDSPLTYSIAATGVPMTAQQRALDPGYARPFASQTVFFGERGIGRVRGPAPDGPRRSATRSRSGGRLALVQVRRVQRASTTSR
jgi:hypothetical protein